MKIMTATRTVTYYQVDQRGSGQGWRPTFPTRRLADAYVAKYADHPTWPVVGDVVERTATFHIGQAVQVDAFGAWRPGTVTKIGATRVTVDYQRSLSGTPASRAFSAWEVRDRVSGKDHERSHRRY